MNKKDTLKEFQKIPGVGKSVAQDLWDLGFRNIEELKNNNPEHLYDKLCSLRGRYIDRCMLYVFRCAVYFATEDKHDPNLLKWWNWKDQKKEPFIEHIDVLFQQYSNPEKAKHETAYMRNKFPFFGLGAANLRLCLKETIKKHPIKTEKELVKLIHILYEKDQREYQHLACELTRKYYKLCSHSMLDTFKYMITTKSWWDTVDGIAGHLVGLLVKDFPQHKKNMDLWIKSENMWLRRSAIIHQLKYKNNTDEKRLFKYCKLTMHEKEFFIRKAIGWALRQYSKTNPLSVKQFIKENYQNLSNLSIREGSKYI